MSIKQTNNTYLIKKRLVQNICNEYLLHKNTRFSRNALNKYYGETRAILNQNKANRAISVFEQLLNVLSPTSRLIIENMFLVPNKNEEWHDKYFSKTTFYKKSKIAMDEFFDLFFGV